MLTEMTVRTTFLQTHFGTTVLSCYPIRSECPTHFVSTPERMKFLFILVYYESIKRELNKRLMFECWCDARLKSKSEGSINEQFARMLPTLL